MGVGECSPGGCGGVASLRGSAGTAGHAARSNPPPQPGDVPAPDQPPDASATQHYPLSASTGTTHHQQDAGPTGSSPAPTASQHHGATVAPSQGAKATPSSSSASTPKVALLFLLQSRSLPLANEALWSMFLQQAAHGVAQAEAASAAAASSASAFSSTSSSASLADCGSEEGTNTATGEQQQRQQQLFRSPPPAAAVRAALHVDLEELVGGGGGGGLKPPLTTYDEAVYPGHIQQHLLAAAQAAEAAGGRRSSSGRGGRHVAPETGGGRGVGAMAALMSQEGQQQQKVLQGPDEGVQRLGAAEEGDRREGSPRRLREQERAQEVEAVRLAARRLADELLGPFPCSCPGPDCGPGNSSPVARPKRTDAVGRTEGGEPGLPGRGTGRGGCARSGSAGDGGVSPGVDDSNGAGLPQGSFGTDAACAGEEVARGKGADTGEGSSTCAAVAALAAEARRHAEGELEAMIAKEQRRQQRANVQRKQQGGGRGKRAAATRVDRAQVRGGGQEEGGCEPCAGNSGGRGAAGRGEGGGAGESGQQALPRRWAEVVARWLMRQADTLAWRDLRRGGQQRVWGGGRKAAAAVDVGCEKGPGGAVASGPSLEVWLAERTVRRQLLAAAPPLSGESRSSSNGGASGGGWGLLASWAWHVASRALGSWLRPAAGAAAAYAGLLSPFLSDGTCQACMAWPLQGR